MIFFNFYKIIYQIFIVLVNTLLHIRHELLSSGSYASFASPPFSVTQLQIELFGEPKNRAEFWFLPKTETKTELV